MLAMYMMQFKTDLMQSTIGHFSIAQFHKTGQFQRHTNSTHSVQRAGGESSERNGPAFMTCCIKVKVRFRFRVSCGLVRSFHLILPLY